MRHLTTLVVAERLGPGALDVVHRGGDERLLRSLDARGPAVDQALETIEHCVDVAAEAEVSQREAIELVRSQRFDAPLPGLDVDVRWRHVGNGRTVAVRLAGNVTGEAGAGADERQVVPGMTGGRDRRQAGTVERARAGNADQPVGRHRQERTPDLVEGIVAEDPPGRREKSRRVDEVGSARLVDVDPQLRVAGAERPGRPGVVKVDVCQREVPQILDGDAVAGELGLERGEPARGAAVDENRIGTVDQIGRGVARSSPAEVEQVDLAVQALASRSTRAIACSTALA